jgi:hypothetical protein
MEWKMLFDADENIFSVKTYGTFDLASKRELIREFKAATEKFKCRSCLIDNTEISSIQIGFMEIYSLPELFKELDVPHRLRIAEIFSERHVQEFFFLETISLNRGYQVSIFSNAESALRWLKQ